MGEATVQVCTSTSTCTCTSTSAFKKLHVHIIIYRINLPLYCTGKHESIISAHPPLLNSHDYFSRNPNTDLNSERNLLCENRKITTEKIPQ